MHATAPYEIIRPHQTTTYFLACHRGQGQVLVDGRWRTCEAGTACLLPAHIRNGLRAVPGAAWDFSWVCYAQPAEQRPTADTAVPVLAMYDSLPLRLSLEGLLHECAHGARPAALEHWVALVHEAVSQFVKRSSLDARLVALYQHVAARLREDWTLERLAAEAGCSREHLRRLCHLEIGRSPMHHVIYLRLRRAAELLAATNEKVETIAQAVGYEDPFVFSKAFHKWVGWTPTDYRGNRRGNGEGLSANKSLPKVGTARASAAFITGLLAAFVVLCASSAVPREPAGNSNSVAAIGAEQQDRSLREEQLHAARTLREVLPGNADAAYTAGYVSNEQGDSTQASAMWEEALRLSAGGGRVYDRADACYNLGYLYLLKEDYARAIPLLQEAIRANPKRQESFYRLAHAHFLAGQPEDCLRVLEEGQVQTDLAWRLRGQAAQQLGRWGEARTAYERAIQLNPELAEAYYGLAGVCARQGDEALADRYREQFNLLKSKGQAVGRQARTDFNPLALTRRSFAQTHTEVGRVYLAYGRPAEAEKLFLRAAEIDPNNTGSRFQLVMLYQRTQNNRKALVFAEEMVRAEPRNAFHYLAVGNLEARLQQPDQARIAFEKVIELAPQRPEGYFALAQWHLQQRVELSDALRLAKKAADLAPTAVNYYVLSQACAANADLSGARAAIQKAREMDPANAGYREWQQSLEAKP